MEVRRYEPADVEALLYAAGETEMARREPGCWPAGYRSGMPECLRDPEDLKYAQAEWTPAQPNGRQIDTMDLARSWILRLPFGTVAEIRVRKIVRDRMQVSPRTKRPMSWRKVGERNGVSHQWAKTVFLGAVSDLTAIANRPLSAPCAGTLARIRAASIGALAPRPPVRVVRVARKSTFEPKPLSAVCAATVARVVAAKTTPAEPVVRILALV